MSLLAGEFLDYASLVSVTEKSAGDAYTRVGGPRKADRLISVLHVLSLPRRRRLSNGAAFSFRASGSSAFGIGLTRGALLAATEPGRLTGADCGVHPIATETAAYQDAWCGQADLDS